MLIKIGDTVYDPKDQPVSVYLADQDKQNIINMHSDSHFYTAFPEEVESESIKQWVQGFKESVAELTPNNNIDGDAV